MKRFIERLSFITQWFSKVMSDLRHDPINDRWVAIASNRRERPMEFVPMDQVRQQIICPFCKGNEDETPGALATYRSDGSQLTEKDDPTSWTVRVVPNKYPSFSTSSLSQSASDSTRRSGEPGTEPERSLRGGQELIVPSSRHITTLSELNDDELRCAFRVSQDRIGEAKSCPDVKHAMWFMNCRHDAGASLGHIHMQLIGSPVVGGQLSGRVMRNEQHFAEHGCSMMKSLMQSEMEQEVRLVQVTENFSIFCPFASRFAYQVFIVPRTDQGDFLTCSDEVRDELAFHCRNLVTRLETMLDNPGYNMLLHLEPFELPGRESAGRERAGGGSSGHWYLEIFPRITRPAGFEWGTDIWVNPVAPEIAARQLSVGG